MNYASRLALASLLLIVSQKKPIDWKTLVPLNTTRTQVEADMGAPVSGKDYVVVYETTSEKITVWYGGATFAPTDTCRWNVPKETIFKFVLAPKTTVRMSELNLNLATFQKQKAVEMVNDYYYYNENEGITITTRIIDGDEVLLNIERGPDAAQKAQHCCKGC